MTDLQRQCIEAFEVGNKQDAERLLPQIEQPADITILPYHVAGVWWYTGEVSLLHLAAHHGWMDIIVDLITKYKCDTNCKDSHGGTPLHYATGNNHLEVVRYFINEQHCDPMTRDNNDDTPLHYACRKGHLNIAQYLISEAKCNPLHENNDGDTPLHYACDYRKDQIVQYLLSTGEVDPLVVDMPLTYTLNREMVSLLHLAADHGWMDIIIDLITKYKCDTNWKDNRGRTPLHYAASNNHLEVVRYFINEQHCDPMTRNDNGKTPLHYAASNNHLEVVRYFINEQHCDPMTRDNDGNPPLDYAIRNNHLEMVKYLQKHCDNDGDTPLHYACRHGKFNIAKCLISEEHCNPSCENTDGNTPLHFACRHGYLDITKYLINEAHCNPSCENNDGDTPLHYACHNNHFDVAKYLICEAHCNPSSVRDNGDRLFHHACDNQDWNFVKYLISKVHCKPRSNSNILCLAYRWNDLSLVEELIRETNCNLSCKDDDGNTPLHYASLYGHAHIVQYLLSTGKVDPLVKNKYGSTPVDWASRTPDNYDVLKLFQSFPQCKRDFPVHTYTKLILTGYSGAGKTTISQLILLLANKARFFSLLSSGRVADVECLTAGIIPLHVESKVNELGNMVIYDFAGQQEYYSSHGAVLERIMRNSAAIFVCIVDLSQCMDKISESIHYWISFIENACSSAQGSSHVIIVGSHADLVKSSQELKEKSSLVESIAESRVKQLTYGGLVSMDCRLSKTKEARHFRSLLSTSQQAILSSQPSMSLYCHVLYAFLRTKLGKTGCTLQELTSNLAKEEGFSPESTLLKESLTSLSDKGLILFISNKAQESSWVMVEKEDLLREVNGTLFAPECFKQYRQVASNTGIVPIATLEELFPQYSSEMLVGCLESMEFCHPVDLSKLQATNLKATSLSPPSGANHLFFPSLVKEHRPGDLPSPRFGWCLGCSDPHQFFSNRFLHVLLLRLAFTFPLASKHLPPSSSLCGLERQCKVWQNGICWKSVSGVSTIVEIVDLNRWVIVLVSEKTREAAQTCSSVIRMILDLQHQLCGLLVTTCECLISPSLLDRYPFDALPDTDLFDLPTVARSMLLHHKLLLDRKEGRNEFSTDEALSCEPYYLLQPSSVRQLFNQSMASQPVPDPLLQEVLSYCQLPHQKPRDHKELRECVNKHSIFAGRNPLVSCSVQAVL